MLTGVLIVAMVSAAAMLMVPPYPASRLRAVTEGRGAGESPPLVTRVVRATRSAARGVGLGPMARRRRAQQRLRVIQSLGALAAELAAGQPPSVALVRCAGNPPMWPAAAGAAHLGGDVVAALVADSAKDPLLRQLAACWEVATDAGAGLAAAVERLAESARAAEEVCVDLEGQLAAPRATARLLALLPIIGLVFGVMLGADPLAWLLGSTAGLICLVSGVALTAVGLWWTGRIAAQVERRL